jgi:hypothetical protein
VGRAIGPKPQKPNPQKLEKPKMENLHFDYSTNGMVNFEMDWPTLTNCHGKIHFQNWETLTNFLLEIDPDGENVINFFNGPQKNNNPLIPLIQLEIDGKTYLMAIENQFESEYYMEIVNNNPTKIETNNFQKITEIFNEIIEFHGLAG